MKKLLGIFTILLFLTSCSNEFDLVTEWKDIPVVFGMISQQDTAHYIRIEKAYLDPEKSALDIARIPDSLYYENISVQLERPDRGKVHSLQRVDGNTEGYQREEGVFADSPNYLYKLKLFGEERLEGGETIRLKINRGDDKELVTAETIVLEELELTSGRPPDKLAWDTYSADIDFEWRPKEFAQLFDAILYFNYEESIPGDPSTFEPKNLEWFIAKGQFKEEGARMKEEVSGESFFRYLQANLENNADVRRRFKSIDFLVIGGGQELKEYIRIGLANTGITSSQVIPTYSNLSEGFGIFTSRNFIIKEGMDLSSNAQDTLQDGIYTRHLNFE